MKFLTKKEKIEFLHYKKNFQDIVLEQKPLIPMFKSYIINRGMYINPMLAAVQLCWIQEGQECHV